MPNQEGAQEEVTQARLLRYHHTDLGRRNLRHPAGGPCHGSQTGPLTGQEAYLAQELPRPEGGNRDLRWTAGIADGLDLALVALAVAEGERIGFKSPLFDDGQDSSGVQPAA
jgi:hypothetical protein